MSEMEKTLSAARGESLPARLRNILYRLASRMAVKVSCVEGCLRGSRERMRILFIHNCPLALEIRSRTFEQGSERELFTCRMPLFALRGFISRKAEDFDLCIANLPAGTRLAVPGFRHCQGQEEVRQIIHVDGAWEDIRQRFSRKRRQVTNNFAEKTGLSYRISRDRVDFEYFHERMHLPLIRNKYGERSEIDDRESMRRTFEKGFLLLVERDGVAVAGALSEAQGNKILFRRSGVLDGDSSHIKGGAQTALYYFQLRHALAEGFDALDSLKSSPFSDDGVFVHKSDWGAVTYRDDEAIRTVHYLFRGPSPVTCQYFVLNPTVYLEGEELALLVGNPDGTGPDAMALRERHSFRGIKHIEYLTPMGTLRVATDDRGNAAVVP